MSARPPLWHRVGRMAYGWLLRRVPGPTAARMRAAVDRWRPLLEVSDPSGITRIAVPGDPSDPVVLLVALGSDRERLTDLRGHLAGRGCRLVWVVDIDDTGCLAGEVVEWVPPRAHLEDRGIAPDTVISARLVRLRQRYRPAEVVVAQAGGPLVDRALVGRDPGGREG